MTVAYKAKHALINQRSTIKHKAQKSDAALQVE